MFRSLRYRRAIVYHATVNTAKGGDRELSLSGVRVHEANLVALAFEKLRAYLAVDAYQVLLEYQPPGMRIKIDLCILDKNRAVVALAEFKNQTNNDSMQEYIRERLVKVSHLNVKLYFVCDRLDAVEFVKHVCKELIGDALYLERSQILHEYRQKLLSTANKNVEEPRNTCDKLKKV